MAGSPELISQLQAIGLSASQIQSIIAAMAAPDGTVNDADVLAAAKRFLANSAANPGGGGNPSTTDTTGTTGTTGTPPGTTATGAPPQFPASPLASNPAATVAETNAYWQGVAGDLMSGAYTPYQIAAAGRGQNPMNRPAQSAMDASPEANLPGGAYAGTVLASTLSPEQAAQVQYNTPALSDFLSSQVAAGAGDSIGLTRADLQNAYQAGVTGSPGGGGFAGDPNDLMAAIQTARQADYAQWIARLQASGVDTNQPGYDQATYERGMGLQPINPGAAPGTRAPYGSPPGTSSGTAAYGMPVSGTAVTPDYTTQVGTSFAAAGVPVQTTNYQTGQPLGPSPLTAQPPPDYAALAAKDEQYAKNLAKSNPAQAKVYADRAAEYRSRIAPTGAGTTGTSGQASVTQTPASGTGYTPPGPGALGSGAAGGTYGAVPPGPPPAQQQQAQTQSMAPAAMQAPPAPPADHVDHYQNGQPVWASGKVGW